MKLFRIFAICLAFFTLPTMVEAQSQPRSQAATPRWVTNLRNNPVIPGRGLAGVQIGFDAARIRRVLGPPDRVSSIRTDQGTIHSIVWNYTWGEKTLVLSFGSNNILTGLRLLDPGFNSSGNINISGIGPQIGMQSSSLYQLKGRPNDINLHHSCPGELNNGLASSWGYDGISFCICGNNKIYWIDIPD